MSMFFVTKIEATRTAGAFQQVRAMDGKHGVFNIAFFTELGNEYVSINGVSRRFKRRKK